MKTFHYIYSLGRTRGSVQVNTHTQDIADQIANLLVQDITKRTNATITLYDVVDWI